MAIDPTLVDLDALPPELAGPIVGIYGPHPRGRATAERGGAQIGACVTLLTERVRSLIRGGTIDGLGDLWTLVERYWPEPMEVSIVDPSTIGLRNTGPVSRYLTDLRVSVDGDPLDAAGQRLLNATVGEAGVAVAVDDLGAESGFYIRRDQSALLRMPVPLPAGSHHLAVEIGLAGVASTVLESSIDIP